MGSLLRRAAAASGPVHNPGNTDPEKILTDLPNADDPVREAVFYIDDVTARAR